VIEFNHNMELMNTHLSDRNVKQKNDKNAKRKSTLNVSGTEKCPKIECDEDSFVSEPARTSDMLNIDGSERPIIVSFDCGLQSHLQDRQVQCGYYKFTSNDIKLRKERLLVAGTNRALYYGKNSEYNNTDDGCALKCMLGIYDRLTGCVQLVDADYYNLHPLTSDELKDYSKDNSEQEMSLSRNDKTDRLVKEFGSAKGKRLLNSRQRNEVKGKALEDAIAPAVSDASQLQQEQSAATESNNNEGRDILPVCHKDATDIEEAYRLQDIISSAEMLSLHDVSSPFTEATSADVTKWRKENKYRACILDRLQLYMNHDEESKSFKSRCLFYLYYLFLLHDVKPSELKRSMPLPRTIPEVIRKKLLDKFTVTAEDSNGKVIRCMPKRLKDCLVLNILLLCLIIDHFHSNCTSLKKDLQLSDPSLKTFVSLLGGKVRMDQSTSESKTDSTSNYFMLLSWPLNFADVNRTKKRHKTRL